MSQEVRPSPRSATFAEVLANSEYRALYAASTLSWLGDYLAKAAVTALVYQQTHSVTNAAAAFAISFLPWVFGGPVLAAIAERYPQRTVMIVCDTMRAVAIGTIGILHLPIGLTLVLLFAAALLNPPFDAARSALLPRIFSDDRYVVAVTVQTSTAQVAQIVGYLSGSALAAVQPRLALLIDAGTFVVSALLARFGIARREAVLSRAQRTHLLHETAQGFRVVFGTPVLRAIAITVLAAHLFTMPPEGLAAPWAARLEPNDVHARGLAQGLIMMATPLGYILGSLLITRLVRPDVRRRLIRPFAILAPVTLIPALLSPPAAIVMVLAMLCGVCVAGMAPTSNGLFVQALPREYRARANGVMMSGLQIVQGGSVLVTGILASHFWLPTVVGLWSVAGVLLMIVVSVGWPAPTEFESTIERARQANEAAEAAQARPVPAPPSARPGPADGAVRARRLAPGTMER